MGNRTIASISPIVIAGAAFVRLGWLMLFQYFVGFSSADFWNHWLVQLVFRSWQ